MHYFLPPKNLLEKYSFLKFSPGEKVEHWCNMS